MSFHVGLGTGLKALLAARMGIQTAGHNVANANTPGYARQRVLQTSSLPFSIARGMQIGTGVDVNDIQRVVDGGLEARMRNQLSMYGRAEVEHGRWAELEGLFGEPDNGMSKTFADLFGKVGKLQTNPADRSLRGGVVQSGRTLAEQFNLLSGRINELKENAPKEINGLLQQINQHAGAIAELNREIVASEANGSTANDLRDVRAGHLNEIANLIDVRAIERGTGSVDLIVGGHSLVNGTQASLLSVRKVGENDIGIFAAKSNQRIEPTGGRIAALLGQDVEGGLSLLSDLDRLAYELALEVNRIHTTGVPGTGGFSTLTAHYGTDDRNGNGDYSDELLSEGGFPFDVQNGALFVTVRNTDTGAIERTKVDIDPDVMTLQDLAQALSDIDHLGAVVDPTGRLRISADSGHTFDFGSRLDPNPDAFGSFGGKSPSFGSSGSGPFDLSGPLGGGSTSFSVVIDGTPQTVTLQDAEFSDISSVTADELATAINNDLGGRGTARSVGGRLVIRSDSVGTGATLQLNDGAGNPLAALGLATGVTQTGQADPVAPEVSGRYTGSENGGLVFVAQGDGQIGVTAGLTVSVYDESGAKVADLEVGKGYSPGEPIAIADGVSVSFNPGTISQSSGDVFAVDTLADSDSSDVLVALGLNSFFHGSTAEDIAINEDLERNPDLLAAGLSGAASDSDNLARWMELRDQDLDDLDTSTIEDFYGGVVGSIGFETATAEAALTAQDQLLNELERQRQAVSGVNLDEEMIDLTRHQQAFEAASRFLSIVNEISNTLINIAR